MATFQTSPEYWVTNLGSLGKVTLAVTILLGVFSVLVVTARFYARRSTNTIGIDDYLMAAGCVRWPTSLCCTY